MEPTVQATVIRVQGSDVERVEDQLVREHRVTLLLGERDILTTTCTPGNLRELAVGHLVSEGLARRAADVTFVAIEDGSSSACVRLQGTLAAQRADMRKVATLFTTTVGAVAEAARAAEAQGALFRATGGTHLALVWPADGSPEAVADISRTCALEKTLGVALLAGVDLSHSILFLTSRVPRLFVHKAARLGIPIIGAVSAPTFEAVQEAERLGICLCGFVRGNRLNVYSRPSRIGVS